MQVNDKMVEALTDTMMLELFGKYNANTNYHAWIDPNWNAARVKITGALTAALTTVNAEPVGCIDYHKQMFASKATHSVSMLIASGWIPVYAAPQVSAPVRYGTDSLQPIEATARSALVEGGEVEADYDLAETMHGEIVRVRKSTSLKEPIATPAPADERVVEAMQEAEETLRLVERPAFPDPVHHNEVKRLGRRIGFGALMSTASAAWREDNELAGVPVGAEFVAGPCHSTVVNALTVIRAALKAQEGGK